MGDVEAYRPGDMTDEECRSLADYKEKGLPGIGKVAEHDIFQWFNLYMAGKTYKEISEIVSVKPDIVLYHAYRDKWFEKKVAHFQELTQKIATKTSQAKLEGMDTINSIISAMNKYYANKFNRFLKTNDESIIESLDPKILSQYYKSMEALDKLIEQVKDAPPDAIPRPTVQVNVGSSAHIQRNGDGSVEITDVTAKDLLLGLSRMKKEAKTEKK